MTTTPRPTRTRSRSRAASGSRSTHLQAVSPTAATDATADAAGVEPGAVAPETAETPSIADLFRKGKTIAAIARTAKVGQDAVRAALDEAGVDYSADKNAKPIEPSAPKAAAAPKEPKTWTLLGSYESILAKPAPTAGSKRAQVVADLATDARAGDLQAIAEALVAAKDPETLALRANALNAALSAHYARV